MLQVSGSCAHIWGPNSVYIKTKPIHMRSVYIMYGFSFNVSAIDFNPLANEWV
jgi:hypothetical protein